MLLLLLLLLQSAGEHDAKRPTLKASARRRLKSFGGTCRRTDTEMH